MTDKSRESTWLITASLVTVSVVAVAVALAYTRAIMVPFVLAIFIISLVSPILDFQVLYLRFPRPLAVFITLLIVMVIVALVCLLVVEAIQTIISTAGRYSDSFANLAKRALARLGDLGKDLNQEKIIQDLRNQVFYILTSTIGTVLGIISSAAFVIIFVIFLLAGRNPRVIHSGVYADIDQNVRRYVSTKVAVSLVTGLLVWAILASVELPLAGIFGMFAFLLNFIPSIGSVISTLLPIPIAVAEFQSFWPIVFVVAVPGVIQLAIGNVIEPKLMGEGLNLHPITVLLALSFWGLIWGVAGMFLGVPITAVIRIVLMQFETLKPIGNLLAGELPGAGTANR